MISLLADDSVTGTLDAPEWELLTKLILTTDRYHLVGPLDEADPCFALRTRIFTTKQAFQRWDVRRLSQALQKLLALGVVERHHAHGRLFLRVCERYVYAKGENILEDAAPQQLELPTAGGIAALPPLLPHSNANRIKQSKAKRIGKNRDAGAGEESENRFATSCDAFSGDERWQKFLRLLGIAETVQYGRLWEIRWGTDADALWACASDWLANKQQGNFAAVATAEYTKRHPERKQAT